MIISTAYNQCFNSNVVIIIHTDCSYRPNMDGMLFKDVIFENEFGTHKTPFASKRMTHKDGKFDY